VRSPPTLPREPNPDFAGTTEHFLTIDSSPQPYRPIISTSFLISASQEPFSAASFGVAKM